MFVTIGPSVFLSQSLSLLDVNVPSEYVIFVKAIPLKLVPGGCGKGEEVVKVRSD